MNRVAIRWWTIGLLCATSCERAAAADLDWNPAKTWVFAVGILEWQNPRMWPPFPAAMRDRRDEQLVNFFRQAGVHDERITYLKDEQATKRRIERRFVELLDQTDTGDLLIFYFCGHGYRDRESAQSWFANYDAGGANNSGWNVHGIFTAIENHFSGHRALLLADCCHSGALYDEVMKRGDSEIAYAAITSSYSHSTSTGNWTYSDSILAALRGEPLADFDANRVIDLEEMARYADLELAFIETQKSMFVADERFPRRARMARVTRAFARGAGQRVEVSYQGKWYKAKTLATQGNQYKVHYTNYSSSWDEWCGPERVRAYRPAQFADGDKVDVRWGDDGKWYPATVRAGWYGLHLVRYDGFDSSWNEWVGTAAIRARTK